MGSPSPPRRLTLLGATGSIGTSTLEVLAHHPGAFEVEALVANRNLDALARAAGRCRARLAVTADPALYGELKSMLAGTGTECAAGPAAVIEAAERPADMVMAAIVGADGLAPTLAAARQGATIALANKECLVSGGEVFTRAAKAAGAAILPVDSEHSAVFQCLEPENLDHLERITLTASGGPFRTRSRAELAAVTPADALKHPNWSMGRKVTIDSATLMNKGLELIEAFHLFPVALDQLAVVIHPQSIVHSFVSYRDGSVIAQLGVPDMRTPIAYALAWPRRIAAPVAALDLARIGTLTFETVDSERFPSVDLARHALRSGGSASTILNAANEVAVAAFLAGELAFLAITELVGRTLARAERDGMVAPLSTLDDVWAADRYGRQRARELAQQLLAQ
ncbi:MAG TPA: 1-deoxy-D-xylulose-5-phosphate reductoisomerase [Aestuariivirgaceae bacterium]|jgi:1-deoxy-D-xylulose-5-phosphate reductoisomerase|nr:1-deoxy-D-xylulose-5-phosphate reductoisomerase [Aestuariivirgaceae bacterium]